VKLNMLIMLNQCYQDDLEFVSAWRWCAFGDAQGLMTTALMREPSDAFEPWRGGTSFLRLQDREPFTFPRLLWPTDLPWQYNYHGPPSYCGNSLATFAGASTSRISITRAQSHSRLQAARLHHGRTRTSASQHSACPSLQVDGRSPARLCRCPSRDRIKAELRSDSIRSKLSTRHRHAQLVRHLRDGCPCTGAVGRQGWPRHLDLSCLYVRAENLWSIRHTAFIPHLTSRKPS
jgi:hypothetical protein